MVLTEVAVCDGFAWRAHSGVSARLSKVSRAPSVAGANGAGNARMNFSTRCKPFVRRSVRSLGGKQIQIV